MSTLNNAYSPNHSFIPPLDPKSTEHPNIGNTPAPDSSGPPSGPKTRAAAVGRKLWTAIRRPRTVWAKHVNSNRLLHMLTRRRKNNASTLPEQSANGPPAGNTANDVPVPNLTGTITEEPRSEPFGPHPPPAAVTEPTDSSISLSLLSDAPPDVSQSHEGRHSQYVITNFDHQFSWARQSNARSSQASTLYNSTYVHGGRSRHSLTTGPPSVPIGPDPSDASPPTDIDQPAPHASLLPQSRRPSVPYIQTNFAQLHAPGSDEEDGHSTIRGGSSSASAVDFHGMGGLFPPSSS